MSSDITERVIHVEPTVDENQYDAPIGPEQRKVDPEQYKEPASPNAADWTSQQRKQEEKARRHEEFKAERAMAKARRESSAPMQGPTREEFESEKKRKFEREQADWNVKQQLKSKDDEYQEEQKEIARNRRTQEASGGIFSKIKQKVTGPSRGDKIREENVRKQTAGGKGLTKEEVRKMISEKKATMGKGQFHAPGKLHSTSFIDPFPHGGGGRGGGFPMVDPLGGMGGSGKHMLDFTMGPRPPAKTQIRATVVSRPPPRPVAKAPKMFQDPFAGLPKGPKRSFDVQKDVGKGLGLGYGKKSAKKLRNVSDWMNF
jgi:hypothetical protein